ncbi:HDL140Cp [Eremothecium sinecaudum]|uniref:HDL140Cp n=1 Tax=Eremothecium sinecaudum TaxID=45286 RepID=A0A0X8HSG5_9SACH|nr:HDL140Cp [Eremothecium sinecaudum]AMD20604.1 HDL140Cp [Eremothecium sinecaudum]
MSLNTNDSSTLDYTFCKIPNEDYGSLILSSPDDQLSSSRFIVSSPNAMYITTLTDKTINLRQLENCPLGFKKVSIINGSIIATKSQLAYIIRLDESPNVVQLPALKLKRSISLFGSPKAQFIDSAYSSNIWGPYSSKIPFADLFRYTEELYDFHFDGKVAFSLIKHGKMYCIEKLFLDISINDRRKVVLLDDTVNHRPLSSPLNSLHDFFIVITSRNTYIVSKKTMQLQRFPNPSYIKKAIENKSKLYVFGPQEDCNSYTIRICTEFGTVFEAVFGSKLPKKLIWRKIDIRLCEPKLGNIIEIWCLSLQLYVLSTRGALVIRDVSSNTDKILEIPNQKATCHSTQVLSLRKTESGTPIIDSSISYGLIQYGVQAAYIDVIAEACVLIKKRNYGKVPRMSTQIYYTSKGLYICDGYSIASDGKVLAPFEHSIVMYEGKVYSKEDVCAHNPVICFDGNSKKHIIVRFNRHIYCFSENEPNKHQIDIPTSLETSERVLLAAFEIGDKLYISTFNRAVITRYILKKNVDTDIYELETSACHKNISEYITSIQMNQNEIFGISATCIYRYKFNIDKIHDGQQFLINSNTGLKACTIDSNSRLIVYDENLLYQLCDDHVVTGSLPFRTKNIIAKDGGAILVLGYDGRVLEMEINTTKVNQRHIEKEVKITRIVLAATPNTLIINSKKLKTVAVETVTLFDYINMKPITHLDFSVGESILSMTQCPKHLDRQYCIIITATKDRQNIHILSYFDKSLQLCDSLSIDWIASGTLFYQNYVFVYGEQLIVCRIVNSGGNWKFHISSLKNIALASKLVVTGVIHEGTLILFDAFAGMEAFLIIEDPTGVISLEPKPLYSQYPKVHNEMILHTASRTITADMLFQTNIGPSSISNRMINLDTLSLLDLTSMITFTALTDSKNNLFVYQFSSQSIKLGKQLCALNLGKPIIQILPGPSHKQDDYIPLFTVLLSDGSIYIIFAGRLSPSTKIMTEYNCVNILSSPDVVHIIPAPRTKTRISSNQKLSLQLHNLDTAGNFIPAMQINLQQS